MFDDNRAHKVLFAMIAAGFSFTILMTSFLRGDIIEINGTYENVKGEKVPVNDKFPVNEMVPFGIDEK